MNLHTDHLTAAHPVHGVADHQASRSASPRAKRGLRRLSGLVVAAAVVAMGGFAPLAGAIGIPGTNGFFQLEGGRADFGGGFHDGVTPTGLPGAPADAPAAQVPAATVTWDYSTISRQVVAKARVRGVLIVNSPGIGRAAAIVEFKRLNGSVLASRTFDTGARVGGNPNNRLNQLLVDTELLHPELHRVSIRIGTLEVMSLSPRFTQSRSIESIANSTSVREDTLSVLHGHADFGKGSHESGAPSQPARITFVRTGGVMKATVDGTLYWDHFMFGTARLIIDFCGPDGQAIAPTRTIPLQGVGGNANFGVNKKSVLETFESGNLVFVKLRVGEVVDGVFRELDSGTYRFQ